MVAITSASAGSSAAWMRARAFATDAARRGHATTGVSPAAVHATDCRPRLSLRRPPGGYAPAISTISNQYVSSTRMIFTSESKVTGLMMNEFTPRS